MEAKYLYGLELQCLGRYAEAAAVFRHVALEEEATASTRYRREDAASAYLGALELQSEAEGRHWVSCRAAMDDDARSLEDRYCRENGREAPWVCGALVHQHCTALAQIVRRMTDHGRCAEARARLAQGLRHLACSWVPPDPFMHVTGEQPPPSPLPELQHAIRACEALSRPL